MSEMSAAEDVAKEAGLILAARFSLFTGDMDTASAISQRLLLACRGNPSTPFELEAQIIDCWTAVQEAQTQIAEALATPESVNNTQNLEKLLSTTTQRKIQAIDDLVRGRPDQFDVDMLMLHATTLCLLRAPSDDILASYNQMIAAHPWFTPALTHKSALLARRGDWEHALDAAQRALDAESDNFDALCIIAVHAFTQESQPHDALSKFEDVVRVLQEKEPSSVLLAIETAALFASICARQPRALQMCVKLLEKAKKHSRDDEERARLLVQLGHVHIQQGILAYESAMNAFKEASKIDPNSVAALEGMILCQLSEGLFDDAEGQIELLAVMRSADELSAEFYYLKAMLAKHKMSVYEKNKGQPGHENEAGYEGEHLACINNCRTRFFARAAAVPEHMVLSGGHLQPVSVRFSLFNYLISNSADFMMRMAVDYMGYTDSGSITFNLFGKASGSSEAKEEGPSGELESITQITGMTGAGMTLIGGTGLGSPTKLTKAGRGARSGTSSSNAQTQQQVLEMPPPVLMGMELLNRVLKLCPGMTCAYIELARTYMNHAMFDEAMRALQQCLSLNPHCSSALLFMSQIEIKRYDTPAANRMIEQALSCDFSIRTSTLFRLVQVMVRAQQGRLDEALTEIAELMHLPEVRSSNPMDSAGLSDPSMVNNINSYGNGHANVLRLTDDDRVGAFIVHASLLSKAKRAKEAAKVLSEARAVFAGQAAQEVQLLVASSQLAVERKDFDSAVRQLDKISEDSPTFAKAQMIKAEILLTNNRDKEGYTKCFQLLVEREPKNAKNYSMLGEAYLRILNPEAAVEALETAYKLDASNGRLRGRIGRALVATHEYHRAVDFYESAIKDVSRGLGTAGEISDKNAAQHMSSEVIMLSHDLAKLYIKLGRIQQSQRVLQRILHEKDKCNDITDLKQNVTTLLLLSEIQCSDQALSNGSTSSTDERKANLKAGIETLKQTYEFQKEVLSQTRGALKGAVHGSAGTEREKQVLSDVCERIAGLEEELEPSEYFQVADTPEGGRIGKINRKAEEMYNEALQHNPQNMQAMLGLARLHKKTGDLDRCRTMCQKIILSVDTLAATGQLNAADSLEDEAAILLSEVLFLKATAKSGPLSKGFDDDDEPESKKDFSPSKGDIQEFRMLDDDEEEGKKPDPKADAKKGKPADDASKPSDDQPATALNLSGAVKPLEAVLAKHPNNYKALERIISLLRRLGRLEEVPEYLTAAQNNDGRAATHAGYHYCQGLYARYTNDVGKAIAEFNMARRDETWGPDALVAMIELYLNPNQEGAWEEREAGPMDDALSNNLNAAEVLLKELKPRAQANADAASTGGTGVSMLRYRVLENYYLLATRLKGNVEKVMQSFIAMLETDPDYLPAVLGMATGFMVEKNSHKARNLLKRVAKLEPSRHDGEDFGKANLLLAKFYVDKSKYDLAQDLCKRTLNQNKSSSQAWEILGLVMEKEQSYDRAAECYERAWKLEFEASAPVGFKLASCYMKAKPARYVDAIDVCEKVLAQYPEYPRIREEILRKCMENVKLIESK